MKKLLVVLAVLVLLPVVPASADTFRMGSTYNALAIAFDGTSVDWNTTVGGGSYDVAQLNGVNLAWVYCVDLEHTINLGLTYGNTIARNDGVVNGSGVSNAGQVAWLLNQYASVAAGNNVYEAALQGAIWEAIYGSRFALTNTGANYYSTSVAWFESSVGQTAAVSSYSWLTPRNTSATVYQGLVTQVPEPGSMLLLGVGLFGLAWAARRRTHRA